MANVVIDNPPIAAADNAQASKYWTSYIMTLMLGILVLPPFWALLLYFYVAHKNRFSSKVFAAATGAFFLSFCLIYLTPIWDNIAHYFLWEGLVKYGHYNVGSGLFSKTWFTQLKLFVVNVAGYDAPYVYFVFLTYFLIFSSLAVLAIKQAHNDAILCLIALIAVSGLFPVIGYTRNAMALMCVCLPALATRQKLIYKIIFIILGFCAAYNLHDSVVILLPAVGLYILLEKKLLDVNAMVYCLGGLAVLLVFFVFPRLLFLISGDMLSAERVSTYIVADGWFSYGSDYIYIPLALGWCAFLLVNILKYRHEINNKYLLSLFITASIFYFASFIGGRYTLRIRMEFISLWTGMLLAYPLIKKNFSLSAWRMFNYALVISLLGYIILAAKPIFYEPWFANADVCRNICLRIFYYPTVFLFDIDTYGFSNSIFETATWRNY